MRQLLIQTPRGCGGTVLDIAVACDGVNLARFEAHSPDGPRDVVIVHVANRNVEGLLERLQELPETFITLTPSGVMPLQPPAAEAAAQVTDVGLRSPVEVFLAGLQSVGSWRGFLGYAAAAGAVVWIGLFTETIYLLIAAMLIAPFAGPAMNAAIATARGDLTLLGRSLLRYTAALLVTIGVAGVLTLLLQPDAVTGLMAATSNVSAVAALLPLVAGAAGALFLIQSERSSLVAGASVGVLVAASLAPPAGLIGMAGVMGRWDMAQSGLFLLLLQLTGINLAGALVFRLAGLSYAGSRYTRGRRGIFPAALGVTLAALIALLTWQFADSPALQRSSRAQQANAAIAEIVRASDLAEPVEIDVRFPGINIARPDTLLGTVYVQRRAGVTAPAEVVGDRLTRLIQQGLAERGFIVTPLIAVTVLEAP